MAVTKVSLAIGPGSGPPSWTGTAACADTVDAELYFPDDEDGSEAKPAKELCAGCEVRELCLAYALDWGMAAGIWGGLSTRERQSLIRARRAEAQRGA